MSKIVLKSITVNRSIEEDPVNYIGAIVDSDSGYLLPKLYKSIDDLDSDLGPFRYSQMYKDLISNGVAACLLPVITPESKYAVCSVRIGNDPVLSVTHPKKYKKYTKKELEYDLTETDINQFDLNEKTYGTILDFSNVELKDLRLQYDESGALPATWLILDTGNKLQMMTSDSSENGENIKGVTTSEYTYLGHKSADYFQFYPKDDDPKSIEDVMDSIKERWNAGPDDPEGQLPEAAKWGGHCYDLKELIKEYIHRFCESNPLPSVTGEENSDWFDKLISDSWIEDFWLASNRTVANVLELIADSFSKDYVLTEEAIINQLDRRLPESNKLLFTFDNPSTRSNRLKLPGLDISTVWNYTQDRLSEYTEDSKIVEFYSKVKGSVGKNISITIETVAEHPNLRNITITNGLTTEIYEVYITNIEGENYKDANIIHITDIDKLSSLVSVFLYNYNDNGNLIDDRFFEETPSNPYNEENRRGIDSEGNLNDDLNIPAGTYVLDRTTDEDIVDSDYYDSLDILKASGWYPDLLLVPDIKSPLDDGYTYIQKILDTIGIVNSNDYSDVNKSIYSQALINIKAEQLNRNYLSLDPKYSKKYTKLKDEDNRILYFHGKVYIDGIEYPPFYPYIYNLLTQRYLEYSSDNFIYDPFKLVKGNILVLSEQLEDDELDETYSRVFSVEIDSIMKLDTTYLVGFYIEEGSDKVYAELDGDTLTLIDPSSINDDEFEYLDPPQKYHVHNLMKFLVDCKINFLKYDNLNYFWETIYEPVDQTSVFMLRYIVSKFSRELGKINNYLLGLTEFEVMELLRNLNYTTRSYLPLVQDSDITPTLDIANRKLNVTISILVPKLINKTFYLNFILNV